MENNVEQNQTAPFTSVATNMNNTRYQNKHARLLIVIGILIIILLSGAGVLLITDQFKGLGAPNVTVSPTGLPVATPSPAAGTPPTEDELVALSADLRSGDKVRMASATSDSPEELLPDVLTQFAVLKAITFERATFTFIDEAKTAGTINVVIIDSEGTQTRQTAVLTLTDKRWVAFLSFQ